MKSCFVKIAFGVLLHVIAFRPFSAFSQIYRWNNLPLGGGGYITGIVFHPKEQNLIYLRTAIGGIYRYVSDTTFHHPYWVQLMDWVPIDDKSLWSVDGLALNPQNPDEVYAALGPGAGKHYLAHDTYPQGVYKSTDRGVHWRPVLVKRYRGNQEGRSTGECLAVSPAGDGSVVLAGTRFDGLFRSTDSGTTWARVPSIPRDSCGIGVRSIAFSTLNPSRVYLTEHGTGVYVSYNAGETFIRLAGTDSISPRSVAEGADGQVWITSRKGVFSYVLGKLLNLSPDEEVTDYNSIAIDPWNPRHVVVSQHYPGAGTRLYQTQDGGASWRMITRQGTFENHVPWHADSYMGVAIADVAFNPFNPRELWFTDWHLPWRTCDVRASTVHFESLPWGVEGLRIFDMAAPPEGALLYSMCSDNGGLRHEQRTAYPRDTFPGQSSTGIDFCERHPLSLVRVVTHRWDKSDFAVSRSDDAGHTWRTVYVPASTGKVAYSAEDTANFIFVPTGKVGMPQVTHDGGKTWSNVGGLPVDSCNQGGWSNGSRTLVSDRVNGRKFYALIGGCCYVSQDGGKTFEPKATGLPAFNPFDLPGIYMAASPYAEGELWVSISGQGVYRSSDSGATFARIEGFENSKLVAVGPAENRGKTVVYVYGLRVRTGWGVYYSLDNGATWKKISYDARQLSANPRLMVADRNYPGRIYIGTGGRGIYVGTPLSSLGD